MSLPTWGAWIETYWQLSEQTLLLSLPTWGALIETLHIDFIIYMHMSLPTWGAWIETSQHQNNVQVQTVAPHVGSVD